MAGLKEIKSRIASVSSTQQITRAMKLVAAAKLRKAQLRMFSMRTFYGRLHALAHRVVREDKHPYLCHSARQQSVLYLLVTSDRGLCGSFNSNVFKEFWRRVQKERWDNVYVMPLGRRGVEFACRHLPADRCMSEYGDIFSSLSYERVTALADHLSGVREREVVARVEVVYNAFESVGVQLVRTERLLPIPLHLPNAAPTSRHDYVYEPGVDVTEAEIVPQVLKNKIFLILIESQASEHAARMTSMSKATDNTEELMRVLKISYNRTRQTAITTELLEIISGADALKR